VWWRYSLLREASWAELNELEPIQQWCAFYLWERFQVADFKKLNLLAAASLGNSDAAVEISGEIAGLLFPHMAQQREDFVKGSMHTLESLRGIGFKIRRADR
jgi:hypothetical protein